MSMRTGNWAEFIAPGLVEYAVNQYQMYSPKYPRYTMVEDMDGAYDESVNATGIKDLVAETEGQATSEQEMLEGYKTRYTPVKYRTKVKITRELYDDGRYGDMRSFVREQISISSRISEEKIATSLWRSGFSAFTSYGDAKRLFSILHPRKDGKQRTAVSKFLLNIWGTLRRKLWQPEASLNTAAETERRNATWRIDSPTYIEIYRGRQKCPTPPFGE